MTIIFSMASPNFILMTSDSAVTHTFKDHQEYDTGRKIYNFPGVGGVTTWGSRDHNFIGRYLDQFNIQSSTHTIEDLVEIVNQYLVNEYKPHEYSLDDVGYHVAGFTKNGIPKLYHVFYGFDRPRPPNQTIRKYERYEHSPPPPNMYFLYNGRNDLANAVVQTFLNQIYRGTPMRFNLANPVDTLLFGDFLTRFGAELTPEVGPPIISLLINQNNHMAIIRNPSFAPLDRNEISEIVNEIEF